MKVDCPQSKVLCGLCGVADMVILIYELEKSGAECLLLEWLTEGYLVQRDQCGE